MAANSLRFELEDPFTCSSIVSLLPRTLGVPLLAPPAASESLEMEKAKSLVESIILSGMKVTLEQAQNIHNSCQSVVSSSQELDTASNPGPDVDFSILKHIRDPEEYFRTYQRLEEADKEIKRLRGEVPSESSKNQWITKRKPRPGLHGTYTFKPTSSLFPTATTSKECIASQQLKERTTSLSNSNPGPDVDFSILKHIRDPEEYFRTHQRLEEADKEIKRLRGEVPSESLKNQQITKRKPRPGLRGGTYTLKPPPSLFPTATTSKECTASQQLEERTTSPSKASTRTESNENTNPNSIDQAHNLDSMETNNRFIAAVEEKVLEEKDKNDFEKLISAFKDLNGDQARALLFETLQIKPIEIKKLELPKLPTSQRPLGKSLDINQLPQNSQTLLKKPDDFLAYWRRDLLDNVYMKPQPDDSSYSGDSSPNTSPQKKTVSSPVDVSYSDQIGLLTSNTSLPATAADKNLSLVNELQTPFNKVDETSDKSAAKEAGRDQAQFSPETITGRITNVERCTDAINKQKEDAGEDAHLLDPKGVDLTPGFANNSYRSRLAVTVDSIGDDHIASGSDNDANRFIDDNLQAQITVRASDIPLASTQAYIENSISMETILPVDVQSQDASLVAGKNVETHGSNATSRMSTNNKKKKEVSSGSKTKQKQKSISRRQSLADAGMIWEFGVRRSTRMKSRPLEFWRGERFLYGRIHDSLATVIGVKRASPGNDGLKVKSFVSEQHADLVARAALH